MVTICVKLLLVIVFFTFTLSVIYFYQFNPHYITELDIIVEKYN